MHRMAEVQSWVIKLNDAATFRKYGVTKRYLVMRHQLRKVISMIIHTLISLSQRILSHLPPRNNIIVRLAG